MITLIRCAGCGGEILTQEALDGRAVQTDEGLKHEECSDEFELAENERRREEGDVPVPPWSSYPDAMLAVVARGEVGGIDWKLTSEYRTPADGERQLNLYRWMTGLGPPPPPMTDEEYADQDRGHALHDFFAEAARNSNHNLGGGLRG